MLATQYTSIPVHAEVIYKNNLIGRKVYVDTLLLVNNLDQSFVLCPALSMVNPALWPTSLATAGQSTCSLIDWFSLKPLALAATAGKSTPNQWFARSVDFA